MRRCRRRPRRESCRCLCRVAVVIPVYQARFLGEAIECLVSAETITLSERACVLSSFQDITGQRTEKVVKALRFIE